MSLSFILSLVPDEGQLSLPCLCSGHLGPRINFITFRLRLDFQIEFIHQQAKQTQLEIGGGVEI